jgi:hypothetical protein
VILIVVIILLIQLYRTWINIKDRRWELMEYFHEMNVIQGDRVILPRLIAFSEDMNVEMPDIKEIKKHYKIVE